MGLHLGRPKHHGTLTFMLDGYWYKGTDDNDYEFRRYATPNPSTWRIRRMWGFSVGGAFVGIMWTRKEPSE